MNTIAKIGSRLLAACAAVMPCAGVAQTVIGSGCATFPAVFNQQQTVTINQPVAAGKLIVVSVAVNALAQFTSVTDNAGNNYPITNAVILDANSGIAAAYAGLVSSALNIGSIITINYFSTGSTSAQSCAEAVMLPGIMAVANPDDAYGTNVGNNSSLSVSSSAPTQFANELVYSVFASATTPGMIGAATPAQGLDLLCSGDNTLCVLPAWNLGATATGVEMAGAAAQNSVSWGALLITFRSTDRLFANGFE
ncbi:MAG TPA: hypothetical protein VFN13_00680 [Rudaea sp.]|nr:hypothetical protein [Rudaea sp.]